MLEIRLEITYRTITKPPTETEHTLSDWLRTSKLSARMCSSSSGAQICLNHTFQKVYIPTLSRRQEHLSTAAEFVHGVSMYSGRV